MNIFDDVVNIDENGNIIYKQWIEWNHFNIPNKPELLRKIMRKIMAFFNHCLKCTSLDGCFLLDSKKPEQSLHPNCDCDKKLISFKKVKYYSISEFPIAKLSKYIFAGEVASKGKQNIFQAWGYSSKDIFVLKDIFEIQAKQNYLDGNYKLKKLDEFGQRLSIPII